MALKPLSKSLKPNIGNDLRLLMLEFSTEASICRIQHFSRHVDLSGERHARRVPFEGSLLHLFLRKKIMSDCDPTSGGGGGGGGGLLAPAMAAN